MTQPLELPDPFGPYRLRQRLSAGSHGTVYLAEDAGGRPVALKVPRFDPAGADTDPQVARFEREGKIALRVRHPNLCPVYDVGQVGGVRYLAMEYVAGQPLSQALCPGEPWAVERALGLVHTLAQALEHLHQAGLIHRDLKPANLMLTPDGTPVVVDFGLARGVGRQWPRVSQSVELLGTPLYMAPEQVQGRVDHLGPACDLYSLGVILYELLTGRPPFAAPEIEALLQEVLRQPPPPPRRLRPDLDPRLEAVVLRALAKDPVDRFASMAAFAATLAPFRPGAAPPAATLPHPPADDDWTTVNDLAVRLRPAFRHAAYPAGQPADAACLLELEVRAVTPARVPADLYLVLDVSLSMDTEQGYPLLRQAVRHLLHQLAPSAADRVGVAVFSAGADLLSPAVPAAELAEGDRLLRRMDASDMKFRAATLLAPGLRRVLDAVRAGGPDPQRVRRVYVLTDGEIHDGAACRPVLAKYRDLGLEVHVYGFGTGFDPVALKELVADQRGGTVKPICHERDLVRTFGHIAAVNQRLAAREGAVVVTFPAAVRAGDAWTFQPKQRWLGAVRQQRLVWEIGALEAGRVYALCFEAALPACGGPTAVAQARLTWQAAAGAGELVAEIAVPRAAGLGPQNDRVARAYDVLDALRRPQDAQAQARASQSELDLALEDGADPALIDALEKRSRVLSGLQPVSALSESDLKVLASDREDGWARPTVRVAAPALFGPKDEEYFANDPSPQLGISPVAQLKDYRQFKAFDVGSPVLPALDRLLAVLEGRAALPTLRGDDLEVLRPLEAYVGALDAVVVFWPAAVKDVPSLIGQLKEFRDWRAAQGTTADHLAALDKLLQVMTWHAPATLLTKADLDRLGGLRDLAVNPAFYASDDYVRTFKVAR